MSSHPEYAVALLMILINRSKPNESVGVLFYNRDHASQPIDLQTSANWSSLTVDASKPLKIICHGWLMNGTTQWYSQIINAYLDLNYNVIALDWSNFSQVFGSGAIRNMRFASDVFANVLLKFYKQFKISPHLIHLIGHSVGVHIISCIAKGLQKTVGVLIGRITALDPAGIFIDLYSPCITLSKADAKFIDVIHTNAGQLGSIQQLGDIDFWVNGGSIQTAACMKYMTAINTTILAVCSHNTAPDYYISSITCAGFIARKCTNYFSFTFGACGNSRAVMGENADQNLRGNYFLNANAEAPYAQGTC